MLLMLPLRQRQDQSWVEQPSLQGQTEGGRGIPDHTSTKVGGKGSQRIQAFARKGFYPQVQQRTRRGLLPTAGDEPGCAIDRDAPEHSSTKVGGTGSQGIQALMIPQIQCC